MNILVTGATGFIGSHLVRALADKHNVKCLVKSNSKIDSLRNLGCEIFVGDIRNIQSLDKCFKDVSAVYHLACQMKGQPLQKEDYWDTNVEGARNIVQKCLEENVNHLIFTTTASCLSIKNRPVDETYNVYDNSNDYKITKNEAERIVLENKEKLNVTVIAPDYVFGPGDFKSLGYFKLPFKKRVIIYNNGTNFLQPVYVEDVVQGLLLALENKKSLGEKFFVSSKNAVKSKDFIEMIATEVGRNPRYMNFPGSMAKFILFFSKIVGADGGMQSYIDFFTLNHLYDIRKAEKLLGYKPRFNAEKIVELTAQWYRDNELLD